MKSMPICHLLITRFNIQYEPEDTIGIQPAWLEERLRLFEQYCIPSVQHQSCPAFLWLLIGDERTSSVYRERIEGYKKYILNLRTYWCAYQKDGYHNLYHQIAQEYLHDGDILITSRLDNDDSIAEDYIERVQQAAKDGEEGIISFPLGKQTFVKDNKSYIVRYLPNHSTSRIEKSSFETIMAFNHALLDKSQLCPIETGHPMWEEIVHGGNVSNDYVPKYHYYIRSWEDFFDLSRRWFRFQANRLFHFGKTRFVFPDKR